MDDEGHDLIHGADAKHTHPDHTQHRDFEASVSEEQWRLDAETLGTNALKRKYPRTFSAFNNISGRVRTEGAEVDPAFRSFKTFLADMGPRRFKDLTLDRIDNSNPRYGPGLCRWIGKKAQARNRRTTHFVTNAETGERIALVALAEQTGVPASRYRRQLKDGWTDAEIFAGQRLGPSSATVAQAGRWPWELDAKQRKYWEENYRLHRRVVENNRYEFRYEFAIRWLRSIQRDNAEFFVDAFNMFGTLEDEHGPASDGRDKMPTDFREDYDRRVGIEQKSQERLTTALEGEASWRESVSDTDREIVPKKRRDKADL
jgi:hypothetical protein